MNPIVEEMNFLMHYGVARRSGRYPWGSGKDPYQRTRDFIGRIEELKKQGWTETPENIKKEFGLTTKEYRNEKTIAKDQRRMLEVARAKSLREDGKGFTDIGREMGLSESTVRSLLDPKSEERMMETKNTVDFLKKQVDEKGMVDVGTDVNRELNISKERLDLALYYLESREGYPVYTGGIPQVTNKNQQTIQRVLCVPGTQHKDIYEYDKIKTVTEYISRDGGETFDKFVYPKSLDSKRLKILLADEVGPDGQRGVDKDGIVEIRRGVPDLSLGESHYAQVRILVDGNKYIKGMAVYSDNLPDGVDILFNSNKTSYDKALKTITDDPDNPFGSLIKAGGQYWYDPKTGERVSSSTPGAELGLINKRADQGDWNDWQDALPSQFLGKQSRAMAKKQLDLAKADKLAEYDDICSIPNPTLKKHLLQKFSDECDSAAVHLKAAALPGQKYHVIIPVNSLKDTEVYAPNYESGTKIALVRYPHGGTFEIPILTVNNKHVNAKNLIGADSIDAIGINKAVADRLSGADFDGDTVMCIPTHDPAGKVKITSTPKLKELEGFDPKLEYPERKGMKYMKDPVTGTDNTQKEMGVISNLITDMTIGGATTDELARAVRHSMVVIDAGKHKLDYKQSEIDNDISSLKKAYQIRDDGSYGGASTILSRAKGEVSVDKRQGTPKINMKGKEWYDPSKPEGAYIYKTADDLYYPDRAYDKDTGNVTLRTTSGKKITYNVSDKEAVDRYSPVKTIDPKTGKAVYTETITNKDGDITYRAKKRLQQSTRMAETDDATTLISEYKHPMELLYADYANSMKALANQARKVMMTTGNIKYNAAAKETYKDEVKSLEKKLNDAKLNTVRERAAQRMANAYVADKKNANPDAKKDDIKKWNQQAISKYRDEVGSVSRKDRNIDITDREWEAIQAGAISENKLKNILNNTDTAALRERATPKSSVSLSTAKINKIKRMQDSNYTLEQIAAAVGCSTSTVSKYLKGVN